MTTVVDGLDRTPVQEEIMEATYRALCTHGYADLTIERIAAEFSKTRATLYYYYEDKETLLVAFLCWILERFADRLPDETEANPRDRLEAILQSVLPSAVDDDRRTLRVALYELRSEAPRKPRFERWFTEHTRFLRLQIRDALADGIDTGIFREVDVETTAEVLVSAITGATLVRTTTGDDGAAETRRGLQQYLDRQVYAAPSTRNG